MLPLRGFRIHSWKAYLIGTSILLVALALWLSGAEGRTISFAHLEEGAVFSPFVFAIVLPMLHGGIYVIASNAALNKHGAADMTVPQPRV
jgi:hypothetical protein